MKKLSLFSALLATSFLAGCGNSYVTPTTPHEKVKTAFSGVENSFRQSASGKARKQNKKFLREPSGSTLDSLFALYNSGDNQGDVIDELSYTEPPMVQFQCLKYAFDKIGNEYSFGTKYYDNVTGKVYVDIETGAETEHIQKYEYDYDFVLSLDINIDDKDLITADISFDITISQGSNKYQTTWYVGMILNYQMDNASPTYTLSMWTNNDERGIPYYNRCVYEYDYVDVRNNKINEWRKFDLEAPSPIVKDASHSTFDAYMNAGMNYKVGVFAWYKNSSLFKAKDIEKEETRKPQVAKLLFDLGLNATDIDGAPFAGKSGNRNGVIKTMYQEFSNIFKKDIIYSLVTREDAKPSEDLMPRYLEIVNYRGDERLQEDSECLLGNKNALFSDLFTNQDVYSNQTPCVPRLKILNNKSVYVRDATNEDIAVKVIVNDNQLVPVAMTDKVTDIANRYHLSTFKLEVSLVKDGEVLDTKKVTINCAPFAEAIQGWPYDVISSLGLSELVPPFTSESYKASVENVAKTDNPLGCEIMLSGLEGNDLSGYLNKLKTLGYAVVNKNPSYAIPVQAKQKVFLAWIDGYTLKIQQTSEYACSYSPADKAIFSALNQNVLLPEGLVFNHPNRLDDFFDYYGVSVATFDAFIQRLTSNGWKENEDPFSWYRYYLDQESVRYCINYEKIGDYAIRIVYSTQDAPSESFDAAEVVVSKSGETFIMGSDTENNLYVDCPLYANQEFTVKGLKAGSEVFLGYSDLEQNDVASQCLGEGKRNNILVIEDIVLRVTLVNDNGVNKIVCTLTQNPGGGGEGGQTIPDHTYTLVGQFNSWSTSNGVAFKYDGESDSFIIKGYQFTNGDGFAILEDESWNVYYGYSHLRNSYSDVVVEGETNGIVPIQNFSATILFKNGVIALVNIVITK